MNIPFFAIEIISYLGLTQCDPNSKVTEPLWWPNTKVPVYAVVTP